MFFPLSNLYKILIQSFLAMGVVCRNCMERFSIDTPCSSVGKFVGFPVITYSMNMIDYRRMIIKRMMDIVGRLSLTPGLTGMWQVSGRSDITDFEDVVKLDLKYIDEWPLKQDVKILIQTVGVVLFRRGSK